MWREHRKHAAGVADLLNWAFMVDDGVILQKDGALLAGFAYRGPDVSAATEAERAALSRTVSEALLTHGDDWCWHFDAVRRPSTPYTASRWPTRALALIDDERRAAYAGAGRRYETNYVLSVTWQPPTEVDSRLRSVFVTGSGSDRRRFDWGATMGAFRRSLDALSLALRSRLTIDRLGSSELCTHLHGCLTGLWHPVGVPPAGVYLNLALATHELVGGYEPRIGTRSIRCVAVTGWPDRSAPGMLETISSLPAAYRWSHRILPLSQPTAASLIRRHQLRWWQKRKSASDWLRDVVSRDGAAPAAVATDEMWLDGDAMRMAHDAAAALALNAGARARFCMYNQIAVVMEDDPTHADAVAASMVAALNEAGLGARVETVNAVDAFLGTLPGHGAPNVRRPVVSGMVVGDLVPVTSLWPGLSTNPCPYYPPDSPPLLWAATDAAGSTPFRVNLHTSDVGHTLIVGATGAGKSTLVALISAQFLRYDHARVVLFDVGRSAWHVCQAAGGRHVDIVPGGEVVIDPLRYIEEPAERAWCAEWLEMVARLHGVAVTAPMRARIDRALVLVARESLAHRTLGAMARQLQDPALVSALAPYVSGVYAGVFGTPPDDDVTAAFTVYELRALLSMDDRMLVPVLLALFRRVERGLDGRPTLIVIEEVWGPLLRTAFAERIKQWLLTLRKLNAAVVLVAHSPAQLRDVPQAALIWESCPTRIYLPHADAASPDMAAVYSGLGLTSREIEALARAAPKRHYYLTSPLGSRMFDLALGPVARALLAPSGEVPAWVHDLLEGSVCD